MTEMPAAGEPDELIEAFWREARVRAKLNPVPVCMGVGALESVRPPAWAFGDQPRMADELAALVVAGVKTATSSAQRDYEAGDEPLPRPGDLGIVLDGAGRPQALIVTTEVSVVPFDQVSADHAHAEGEGDRSLSYWRRAHRDFFTRAAEQRGGAGFTPDMPVVLERFEVLVPVGVKRGA